MTTAPTRDLQQTTTAAPAWALGLVVGLGGLAAMVMTGAGFSVSDDMPINEMIETLDAARGGLLVGGGVQALVAMGLVIYAAIIRRTLAAREPDDSLTPTVAFGGALLSAAMLGFAAATTQLVAAVESAVDPAIPLTVHVFEENLFAGAWCSLALVAGAIAFAGLRRGSVARWFAGVSAFVAILLVVAQVVVPWAGWFPAAIWLAVSSFGLRARAS